MPRKALVVRGGWDGHAPVAATELFIPFLEREGFTVRVEESNEVYEDEALLASTDLVVQTVTMSTIERSAFEKLRTAVEGGLGFAGWHGGIADSYRNNSDYLHMVGGQFATHPGKPHDGSLGDRPGDASDNFLPYTIEINEAGRSHPITQGIEDFELVNEQYWVLHDDYIDVLATTTHPAREDQPWHRPVTSPAVWTRQWGEGRIFVATPGHDVETLQHASVRTIIERGLLWASRTA